MTEKGNQNRSNKLKQPKKKTLQYIILSFFSVLLLAIILFTLYVFEGLPSLEDLESPKAQLASNVWSKDGKLIGQFYKENRVEVPLDSIPPHVINALIATEDKNFYSHWGVDLQRFIKAMIKNVLLFKREGASTITQQLAKNLYGLKVKNESKRGTIVRKIREWITAVQIEKTYTKREILEMYFNISHFGHSAYGIGMAARVYFDKSVKQLSVTDACVLVALLKGSAIYDPFTKYDNALKRRNLVLSKMLDEGFITESDFDRLKQEPIHLSYKKIEEGIKGSLAPHFVEYIRQQMEKLTSKHGFNLYEDGLNIYTTLDSRMQNIAVNVAQKHVESFQKEFDRFWNWQKYGSILNDLIDKAARNRNEYKTAKSESEKKTIFNRLIHDKKLIDSVKNIEKRIELGFVAIDPKNGEIKAMVGGRDQKFLYGLNHVTQIRHQQGSAFKPFIYAAAIDNGLFPAYPIENRRFQYDDGSAKLWSPENFDRTTSGFVTLRHALVESLNLVAARLIIEEHVKLWQVGRFAEKMGIKSKLDLVPSISLGTSIVTPLELTASFATLANHGIYNEPISILRIEDKDGVLIENFTSYTSEAISEDVCYVLTDMMRSAIDYGTGQSARSRFNFHRPAAGKTGTNTDYRDAWYVGFTPQLAAGAWVGFDDQRVSFTGDYGQGARAALPIWAMFMHDVYEQLNLPVEDFTLPASGNVVSANFCKESIYELGDPKLVSSTCRTGTVTDILLKKDIPPVFDAFRDTTIRIFDKYLFADTLKHEAREIR